MFLGGTIIFLQNDGNQVRKISFKVYDIPEIRSSESVDALVHIADGANIFMLGRQKFGQIVLAFVSILILVNQNIFPKILIIISGLLVLFQ